MQYIGVLDGRQHGQGRGQGEPERSLSADVLLSVSDGSARLFDRLLADA
jgi:hypothetical protein